MNFSLVVAMDKNGVIGNNNNLPWKLPNDLKHVRKLTENNVIVMGRKNYESIGKPLPNRRNIILTRDTMFHAEGCEICRCVNDVLNIVDKDDDVFIFGGAEIYKLFLPQVTTMFVTIIHHEFKGDIYFPEINWDEWEPISKIEGTVDDKNCYPHTFYIYERKPDEKISYNTIY